MLLRARLGVLLTFLAVTSGAFASEQVGVVRFPGGSSYDAYVGGLPNHAARQEVARRFYEDHGDAYDFLIVFPTVPADLGEEVTGLHTTVRRLERGLGLAPIDVGSSFGSSERLKGYVDVLAFGPDGVEPMALEAALEILAHEVAHQWSGRLRFEDASSGSVRADLLGKDGGHWSFFLDSDGSVLYGADWEPIAPGRFEAVRVRRRYSSLDLYAMGFLEADELEPLRLLEPTSDVSYSFDDVPPPEGTFIDATVETVTIQQIIAAEGPRVPASSESQRTFRAAFVVLAPDDESPVDPQLLELVDAIRVEWANRFFFLTRGRAFMETDLVDLPASAGGGEPSIDAGLAFLLGQQHESGSWADVPETGLRDTSAAIEALAAYNGIEEVDAAITRGADALIGATPQDNDGLAHAIIGLRAAGRPTSSLVSSLLSRTRGPVPGLDQGYDPTPWDVALGGLALSGEEGVQTALAERTELLASLAAPDGGWSTHGGGEGRLLPTATVLRFLRVTDAGSNRSALASEGLGFLTAHEAEAGLFVEARGSLTATAEAALAMDAWGVLAPSVGREVAKALLARQELDGSWEHSAHVTSRVLLALRRLRFPNLTLDPALVSASPASVFDGETIEVSVEVGNEGYVSVESVEVQLFDGDGRRLGEPRALDSLDAGETRAVSFLIDTTGMSSVGEVYLVVDPAGAISELREDDNRVRVPLEVLPPPPGPDLYAVAGSVQLSPISLERAETFGTVEALVGNLGWTDVDAAEVEVRVGGLLLGTTTVALPSRGFTTVVMSGPVVATGDPSLPVALAVDPRGLISEASEENNSTSASWPVTPTVDLGIAALEGIPSVVEEGTDLTPSIVVRNRGTVTAGSAEVKVRALDLDGVEVGSILEIVAELPPGQARTFEPNWRARPAGALTIEARVSWAGTPADSGPGDEVATASIEILPSTTPNLRVDAASLSVLPEPPRVGAEATLTGRVLNEGSVASTAFDVDLWQGQPGEGERLGIRRVDSLDSGEEVELSWPWSVEDPAPVIFVMQVDPGDEVTELDEDDNLVVLDVTPLALPDLVLADGGLSPEPRFPRAGATVPVSLEVSNEGGQPSGEGTAILYLDEERPESVLATASLPNIEAGARASVILEWSTGGVSGSHILIAVVRSEAGPKEARLDNNRAEVGVRVQDADLAVSNPYFSPNGDGVKDETRLYARLDEVGDAHLQIRAEDGSVVRVVQHAEPASDLELPWDGRKDDGTRADDGVYRLTLHAGLEPGEASALIGSVEVTLDTNLLPLHEAAPELLIDEPVGMENVYESGFREQTHVTALPDGAGLVGYAYGTPSPCGEDFYEWPLGGGPPERLTPENWGCDYNYYAGFAVSPDGRWLAYQDYMDWAKLLDLETGQTTLLERVDGILWRIAFTPDGERLVMLIEPPGFSASRLRSVRFDGSDPRETEIGDRYFYPVELAFGPGDGQVSFLGASGAILVGDLEGGSFGTPLASRSSYDGWFGPSRAHGWLSADELVYLDKGTYVVGDGGGGPVSLGLDGPAGGDGTSRWEGGGLRAVAVSDGELRELYTPEGSSEAFAHDEGALTVHPRYDSVAFLNRDEAGTPEVWSVDIGGGGARSLVRPFPNTHRDNRLSDLHWSPDGDYLYYERRDGPTYLRDYRTLSSLANLTVRLSARRPPGSTGFVIRATATDAHLESWRIEARPVGGLDAITIAGGTKPVIDGEVMEWIPAGPGLYELTLSATDMAGNVRHKTTRVAWSETPPLSNIRRDFEYISPNGDGVQDAVRVDYLATGPTTFDATVVDRTGTLVRTMSVTHLAAGEHSLSWDGRDATGSRVPDEVYALTLGGVSFEVVVDTQAPVVDPLEEEKLQLSAGFRSVSEDIEGPYEHEMWMARLEASAEDPNLDDVWLEIEGAPETSRPKKTILWLDQIRGRRIKIRARDRAGNESVTDPVIVEETLFLTALGDAEPLETLGADLQRAGDGRPFPPLHRLEDELFGGFSAKRYAFAIEHSIATRIERLEVAYRFFEDPEGEWTVDPGSTTRMFDDALVWDARNVKGVPDSFQIRAYDESGRLFVAMIPWTRHGYPTCLSPSRQAILMPNVQGVHADVALRREADLQVVARGVMPSMSGVVLPIPGSSSTTCEYTIEVDAEVVGLDGLVIKNSESIAFDVCATRVAEGWIVDGEWATFPVRASHEAPVDRVEVLLRAPGTQSWTVAAQLEGFRGTEHARVNVADFRRGELVEHRLITYMEDGRVIEGSGDVPVCSEPELLVPALSARIERVEIGVPGGRCEASSSVHELRLFAKTALSQQIVSMTAKLVSVETGSEIPLELSNMVLGSSASAQVTVQESSLLEGRHRIALTAADELGDSVTVQSKPGEELLVDLTAPVAALESPAAGASVCASTTRTADGRVERTLAISGLVADAHLTGYRAEVLSTSGMVLATRQVSFETPTSTSISGSLAPVPVGGLPGGDYRLRLSAQDVSHSETCSAEVPFRLVQGSALEGLAATPPLFSPDGDGLFDVTQVSVQATEAGELEWTARAPNGAEAPIASGPVSRGTATLEWTGPPPGGIWEDGVYSVEARLRDGCGSEVTARVPVTVDLTAPQVRIDAPAVGAIVASNVEVRGLVQDAHLEAFTVELGAGRSPASFSLVYTGNAPRNGSLATVRLADLEPGEYTLRLRATDRVGHESEASAWFQYQPGALIRAFAVSPGLISPDGDGTLDEAVATLELEEAATATLTLVGEAGEVVAELGPPVSLPAGVSPLRLAQEHLAGVVDGAYQVAVTASGAGLEEDAEAPLGLDNTPPEIAVDAPQLDGWVGARAELSVTFDDANLESWTLEHQSPGGGQPIASGDGATPGHDSVLDGLEEGAHSLLVVARDAAGNTASVTQPFRSDQTPPEVAFSAPLDGAWLADELVEIAGVAEEEAPAETRLLWVRDGVEQVLDEGVLWPGTVGWNLEEEPDGDGLLRIVSTDLAGNVGEAEIEVRIDRTAPVARIDAPRDEVLTSSGLFSGTASDENLERWTLELSDGTPALAARFVEIATGEEPVVDGALTTLSSLPGDGDYTVRLRVTDEAGNRSEDLAGFVVDTTPPSAPLALAALVQPPRDVALSWTASPEPDVVGYHVYRARGEGAPERTTVAPVTDFTYLDAGLSDGELRYTVTAVDAAGFESAPSNEAVAEIDTTPPLVRISTPSSGQVVSGRGTSGDGLLEVEGTAYASDDFRRYRLWLGAGLEPDAYTLLIESPAAVQAGTLGSVEVGSLPEGSVHTLRLEAEDTHGNVAESRATFELDELAPSPPVLVSANLVGRDAHLKWEVVEAPDLAGYLVYRDGALANGPDDASFDELAPYILPAGATTYVDADLPDGTHTYWLQAVDRVENLSADSNRRSITLEGRAPTAWIAAPQPLARLRGVTEVVAESEERDLAQVALEARAGVPSDFTAIGPPPSVYPYRAPLDPSPYAPGLLELRAIATDTSGNVDPSPGSIFVFHDPPMEAPVLLTTVDGDSVAASWSHPEGASRIAGYAVHVDGESLLPPAAPPPGTATASATSYGSPEDGYDGDPWSAWEGAYGVEQHWEVVFDAPTLVEGLTATLTYGATVLPAVKVDGLWLPMSPQTDDGDGELALALGGALRIEGVRLTFPEGQGRPWLEELMVEPLTTTTASARTATGLAEGERTLTVTAVSPFGQAVSATAQARIWAPVLESLPAVVAEAGQRIEGSGATSGATVSLVRLAPDAEPPYDLAGGELADGEVLAQTISDGAGAFGFDVSLDPGESRWIAVGVDGLGNRSLPSAPVTVIYAPAPSATPLLAVEQIDGSDVMLALGLEGDLSAVAALELERRVADTDAGGGPWTLIDTLVVGVAAYVDPGLANGSYLYRLAAVNAHGIRGSPSPEVQASVSVEVPSAPATLTVSAPPEGGALQLDWSYEPSTGESSQHAFVVERAPEPDGAFTVVAHALPGEERGFLDVGLEEGRTYWYRVQARDPAGNPSPYSNVAAGTVRDTVPPAAPVITAPTRFGTSVVTGAPTTDVGGTAEPEVFVQLFQNGELAGGAQSSALQVVTHPIPTALPITEDQALGPDGRHLAYVAHDPASNRPAVVVEELDTGATRLCPSPAAGLTGPLAWAPDGSRVAVEGVELVFFPFFGSERHVYLCDLASGVLSRIDDRARTERGPRWSPDGARIAYQVKASGAEQVLAVRELATDAETLIASPGEHLFTAGWADSQTPLVFARSAELGGASRLAAVDLSSGALEPLLSADEVLAPMSVDRATARAAVMMRDGGEYSLALVNLMNGAIEEPVPATSGSLAAPAFSPDGTKLAYRRDGVLTVLTLASGAEEALGEVGTGRIGWLPDGRLTYWRAFQPLATIDFAARFEVPDLELLQGENELYAVAVDGAGNRSPGSLPIFVTFDGQGLPDLALSATVQPAIPVAGERASAYLTIENVGEARSDAVSVSLRVEGSDGSLRAVPGLSIGALEPGASTLLAAPLELDGLTGTQMLRATVDPGRQGLDRDRSNDSVAIEVRIAATAELALEVTGAPAFGTAFETAVARVSVANPGAERDVAVGVSLLSSDGIVVATTAPERYAPLASGEVTSFERTLPLGTLLAGPYVLEARAWSGEASLAIATAPYEILPAWDVELTLASSRTSYLVGEPVELEGRVLNGTPNALLEGASYLLEVRDATGALVHTETHALPVLALDASRVLVSRLEAFSSGALAPGSYEATATVELESGTLASSTASFSVEGVPVLEGALALVGTTGEPLGLPKGVQARLVFTIHNAGTGSSAPLLARVVVSDAVGAPVLDVSEAVGVLGGGLTASGLVSLETAPLAVGLYTARLVTQEEGGDGSEARLLAALRFRVTDPAPPSLAFANLFQEMLVRGGATVRVAAEDADSGVAAVGLAVDGAAELALTRIEGTPHLGTWAGDVVFPVDGPHVLTAWGSDAASNDGRLAPGPGNPISVTVVSDTLPPELAVSGVLDGELTAGPVVPFVAASDLHLSGVEVSLDGASFLPGTPITSEGPHELVVRAYDGAGNDTVENLRFEIDTTAPSISIGGVGDGAHLASTAYPSFSVRDAHLDRYEATLDGVPFPSGAPVSGEGTHVLRVEAWDLAGNHALRKVTFTVDLTPPAIMVTGVVEGMESEGPVVPVVTVEEPHLRALELTLNGAPFISGTPVSEPGEHMLHARAEDLAGNVAERTVTFSIVELGLELSKRLSSGGVRVLALVKSAKRAPSDEALAAVSALLEEALPDMPLEVVIDDADFLSAMRSDAYNVLLLFSVADAAKKGEGHDELLRRRVLRELTERVHSGRAGLLVFRAIPPGEPPLREVSGVEAGGKEHPTSVSFLDETWGTLTDSGGGVTLRVLEAEGRATFGVPGPADPSAAAAHGLGRGRSMSFGFDPSRATPSSAAASMVARAVGEVTPPPGVLAPLSVAGVELEVHNLARPQRARVTELLHPPDPTAFDFVAAVPEPSLVLEGDVRWELDLEQEERRRLDYWIRLPGTEGRYELVTRAEGDSGGAPVSATLSVEVTETPLDLVGYARAELGGLSQDPSTAAARGRIATTLDAAETASLGAPDGATIEQLIGRLLDATDDAAGLGDEGSRLRYALDELLHYWEARWYAQ